MADTNEIDPRNTDVLILENGRTPGLLLVEIFNLVVFVKYVKIPFLKWLEEMIGNVEIKILQRFKSEHGINISITNHVQFWMFLKNLGIRW